MRLLKKSWLSYFQLFLLPRHALLSPLCQGSVCLATGEAFCSPWPQVHGTSVWTVCWHNRSGSMSGLDAPHSIPTKHTQGYSLASSWLLLCPRSNMTVLSPSHQNHTSTAVGEKQMLSFSLYRVMLPVWLLLTALLSYRDKAGIRSGHAYRPAHICVFICAFWAQRDTQISAWACWKFTCKNILKNSNICTESDANPPIFALKFFPQMYT